MLYFSVNSFSSFFPRSVLRPINANLQPFSAKSLATPAPIPDVAPVTTPVLPSSAFVFCSIL